MNAEKVLTLSSNNTISFCESSLDSYGIVVEPLSFDYIYNTHIMDDLRNTNRWIGSIYNITENNLQHVEGMLAIGTEIQEQLPFFSNYVDWDRFSRICKIHDWGETIPGDVAVLLPEHSDPEKRYMHKQKEFFALRMLVSTFPYDIQEVILQDYEAYEKGMDTTDITVLLVHAVDKIQGIRTLFANGYEIDSTDTVTIKKIAEYRDHLGRLVGNDYKAQREIENFL